MSNQDDIILSHQPQNQSGSFGRFGASSATGPDAALQRRRKITLVVGAALFGILVVVALVAAIINLINSATVNIAVAPTDATISIDGVTFTNGTYKMQPGTYTVEVTRAGFESYTGTLEAIANEEVDLYLCLDTTDATTGWYDDDSTEDYQVCQAARDRQAIAEDQAWLDSDPILRLIPYYNYNGGYSIDYQLNDDESFTIIITPLTCQSGERADNLYNAGLQYLESQGIDLDNYTFERGVSCSVAE